MIDNIKTHVCKGNALKLEYKNGIKRAYCAHCGELLYEATEYEDGLLRLKAKERDALQKKREAEEESQKIEAEVDSIREDIVKYKESHGIYQNVR